MKILVTGGAGFIGRWVVKHLLEDNNRVWVIDDLSNGSEENLNQFRNNPNLDVKIGDIKDAGILSKLLSNNLDKFLASLISPIFTLRLGLFLNSLRFSLLPLDRSSMTQT